MSTQLAIYGESAGSVAEATIGTATQTPAAGRQFRITKMSVNMAGVGYAYLDVNAAHVLSFYFWAAGQQSEDNLSFIVPAGQVCRGTIIQAGGAQVTRCLITGVHELISL